MNAHRIPVLVAAVGLTLAACGTSDGESAPTDVDAPPETVATPTDDTTDAPAEPADDAEPSDTDASAESEIETADAPTNSDVVATDAPPSDTAPEVEPPAETDAPATPEVGGRVLAAEVDPASQFDGNPFPDLVVEDVGRGGQANLANLLPSDRPLLLWAWAPH